MSGEKRTDGLGINPDEVIDAVYEGALEPSEYLQLFEAWDRFFLDPAAEDGAKVDQRIGGARELEPHFRRAARIFELTLQSQENEVQSIIEDLKYAAFVVGADGRISMHNQPTKTAFLDCGYSSIFDYAFNADVETRVKSFLRDQNFRNADQQSDQLCVTGEHPETGQNLVFVIEPMTSSSSATTALVKTTSIAWNEDNERMLISAFGFTQAETDIIQAMINGYALKDIADQRGRSLSTIRTQIKMILQKTGLGSQKELLRLVTSICFILDERTPTASAVARGTDRQGSRIETLRLPNGRSISYVITGAENGQPVLVLQPTTRPDFTSRVRDAFLQANLCVISPIRPGSWGTDPLPKGRLRDDLIDDYAALVEALDHKIECIAGYCSGGLYALALAQKLGPRIKRVVLIDTGAPLEKISKIRAMPRTERRTFLTARLFPSVLLVPHRLIASDFHRSPKGERKTVEYFYADSPHDRALIDVPEFYQITRDNIAYCFENVPQLVSAVVMWAQDWSADLEAAASTMDLHFIHGDRNMLFTASDVEALSTRYQNVRASIIENAGQTLLYEHPDRVAALIAE